MKNYMSGYEIRFAIATLGIWLFGCVAILKISNGDKIDTMGKKEKYNLLERLEIWATTVTYVDIDTGEVIDQFTVKGIWTRQPLWVEGQTYMYGDYEIISKTVEYEKIRENTGHKWLRYNCQRAK